ncbi:hypothetical protein K439DRAFT_1333445 [Ramaria rubella]|nr:hypothetical protein K439DRAFT_1333445 [Ramaria rubella]
MLSSCAPVIKPHPKQGGQYISETYLYGLTEAECVWRFRFTAGELVTFTRVMLLPDPLITHRGYQAPAIECISLLCACLRIPDDQWSLSTKYACPQSAISF